MKNRKNIKINITTQIKKLNRATEKRHSTQKTKLQQLNYKTR